MATSDVFAAAHRGEAAAVLAAASEDAGLVAARGANGWTLLHIFARLSMAKPVERLLALGADCEARDDMFRSALHHAAAADASPTLARGTADGLPLPPPELAAAVLSKTMIGTLQALLKVGARVTARDSFGLTALHHAAHAGHTDAVLFLLSLNTELRLPRAPLEAETNHEERPLHLAAAGGHASTVRMLLQQRAHPGKTNYLGETALHLAVKGGDSPAALDAVRELVLPEWRADLSVAANDGSTPLHVAAAGGHSQMVMLLMRARNVRRTGGGRSVVLDARDKLGRTPEDVARSEGFDDVAVALASAARVAAEKASRSAAEEETALQRAFAETRLFGGSGASSQRAQDAARATAMLSVGEGDEEASLMEEA